MTNSTQLTGRKGHLQILHTSDLHIGNDYYPDEALNALESVLRMSCHMKVHCVLIAGDLFDNARVHPDTVRRVMDDLGSMEIPVMVLPGNHDTVLTNDNGLHSAPDNVFVLKDAVGETILLEDLGLSIWGRPVYDHYPGFRPLEGVGTRPSDTWHLVMAHGMVMSPTDAEWRSSPIMPEEIAGADCDYVALGHIHLFRDVSHGNTPAFYCGAPSGPQARTVALVDLDSQTGVSVKPLPVM